MLPKHQRVHRRSEFALVMRGRRVSGKCVVVHYRESADAESGRMGLIVSKTVGNAVCRHRVSRRLRHVYRDSEWAESGYDVVIRALSCARTASSAQLAKDLEACRQRAESR